MNPDRDNRAPIGTEQRWDTSSHTDFFKYYENQSQSEVTMARFSGTADSLLRLFRSAGRDGPFRVLDIGCGAGTQGRFWLDKGHRYCGLDINQPLIELARQRAMTEGLAAEFKVGSASRLPFDDGTFDVCLMPFILEHVVEWANCVDEALRVLGPGGLIYISTTNKLCPRQDEFNLPMYAWYPAPLKRHYERRAVTDWPAVVNFARYPAVNWFSIYQLAGLLADRGCETFDRFDIMDSTVKGPVAKKTLGLLRTFKPAKFVAQVLTPFTLVVGRKAN